MRILVVMQSSTEKLYQDAAELLKKMYNEVIERKSLPVDVISYVGDSQETYLDGDTLYIACDNKLSIEKHRQLYKYIYDHKEYDVIIKTNVSTVLNLELICKLVVSMDFYKNNMYCASIMWDNCCSGTVMVGNEPKRYGNFPVGYFNMADRKIWEEMYEVYDSVVEEVIRDLKHNHPNKYPLDVNDDCVTGALLVKTGHTTMQMSNFVLITAKEMEPFIESAYNMDTFFSSICTRCKLHTDSPNDIHMRELYEPIIMRLVATAYFDHNTTFEDIYKFVFGMKWFVL